MMRILTLAVVVGIILSGSLVDAQAPKTMKIKNLKVLVPIYRGVKGSTDYIDDARLIRIKKGCELARDFYFRNTYCKLNLQLTYLPVDIVSPNNENANYDNITADLRRRGIKDGQYDGFLTTGVGMAGNYGGFDIFGGAGAAFGGCGEGEPLASYAGVAKGISYDTTWIFVHEFQHALDLVICQNANHPEMLMDHPYADSMESYFKPGHHAGMHWDWVAHCLRTFTSYLDVGVRNEVWIVTDADQDGMPDNDPRLPMDEKRFGSSPNKADSDGDGLDDLHEYTAGIYDGTDPREADTDGDGIRDGQDTYPLVNYAPTIRYAAQTPTIDGTVDAAYAPLIKGVYKSTEPKAGKDVVTYAAWDEGNIYMAIDLPKAADVAVMIDGSGENGFWEGGDTYIVNVTATGEIRINAMGPDINVPDAKAAWKTGGGRSTVEFRIPRNLGQGISRNINYGGPLLPEDTATGLTLERGRVISVNVTVHFPDTNTRAVLIPNFVMYDTTLTKLPTDPERPSLEYSVPSQATAYPVVKVTGINPTTPVRIEYATGGLLGARVGNGDVVLSGVRVGHDGATGSNVIRAKTPRGQSDVFGLVVDTAAPAPDEVKVQGDVLTARVEPGAAVEVYWTIDGMPVDVLGVAQASADGVASFPIPKSLSGFTGRYYNGVGFEKYVFSRIDPKIEFDYQDGKPDSRIDADAFSIKWTGYLWVAKEGEYTFYLATDDGSRLYIDDTKAIDHWGHHEPSEKTGVVKLAPGWHGIEIDYYEDYGWASARLAWSGPGIAKTYALPVAAILPDATAQGPDAVVCPSLMLRQRDALGNVSAFTAPVSAK